MNTQYEQVPSNCGAGSYNVKVANNTWKCMNQTEYDTKIEHDQKLMNDYNNSYYPILSRVIFIVAFVLIYKSTTIGIRYWNRLDIFISLFCSGIITLIFVALTMPKI